MDSLRSIAGVLRGALDKLGDVGAGPGSESDLPVDLSVLRRLLSAAMADADSAMEAMEAAEGRALELASALEDSEKTHMLRNTTADLLKQEIAELRRNMSASSVDTVYLKAVLVNAFECGELPSTSPVLTLVSRLLHFSPDEVDRCHRGKRRNKSSLMGAGLTFQLPSFTSSPTPAKTKQPPSAS